MKNATPENVAVLSALLGLVAMAFYVILTVGNVFGAWVLPSEALTVVLLSGVVLWWVPGLVFGME